MVLEQLDIFFALLLPHSIPKKPINLKWIIDPNERPKTVKLLEENLREYLSGLGDRKRFLWTWEAKTIRENIDKSNFFNT